MEKTAEERLEAGTNDLINQEKECKVKPKRIRTVSGPCSLFQIINTKEKADRFLRQLRWLEADEKAEEEAMLKAQA